MNPMVLKVTHSLVEVVIEGVENAIMSLLCKLRLSALLNHMDARKLFL